MSKFMTGRILVVDDNESGLYTKRKILERAGFTVTECRNGAEALEAVSAGGIDLILLDVNLPDFDGIEVCRRIKSSPLTSSIAVVHISATRPDTPSMLDGYSAGAELYLPEPIDPAVLVAIMRAVTRAREMTIVAEERARRAEEAERTLDALMQHIPEGITIADGLEGKIRRVSRFGAELLKRAPRELEGAPYTGHVQQWQWLRPDGSRPQPEELPLARAVLCGEVTTDEEWLAGSAGGDVLLLCNAGPIRNSAGEVTGGVMAWRDIRKHKALERRLHEAQRAETTARLTSGIAHEFNNKLTAVIGALSLALDILPGSNPVGPLLGTAIEAGKDLAHLTSQLLAYGGKGRFVLEPVDIADLTADIPGFLRPLIPPCVELKLESGKGLPEIIADAGQMRQVISNLILNAAESYPPGAAGLVTVKTGVAGAAEIGAADAFNRRPDPAARYVFIEVSDNGCGIEPNAIPQIFDPFFTTKFVGRGLGLAAVSGIVRGHRGLLTVESRPGRGSTFRVCFPAVETAATAPVQMVSAERKVIVVADDEPVVRKVATTILEGAGYRVITAENGREALQAIGENSTDLVLLDLKMPVMGGEEALRIIRREWPGVKVLVSSGYGDTNLNGAADGSVPKPYSSAGLVEGVRAALERPLAWVPQAEAPQYTSFNPN